jgi:hypothetical protein
MYNYRVTSFVLLTGTFWSVAMVAAVGFWICLALIISNEKFVKEEDPAEEARGRSPTVKASNAAIKEEPGTPIDPLAATGDADDEDEEEDYGLPVPELPHGVHSDSGIGTSMESGSAKPTPHRRRGSRTIKTEDE